jgi:hypothetical protein
LSLALGLLLLAGLTHAEDGKDEFTKKVVTECKKSQKDAEELATPGRTGNVVKYKLCPQSPVELAPDCKVSCGASGNVVGN